ncbi:hypothetical protein COO91_02031 [Nostoc flagelliforme CCNUN1]|uniref:Uncharacterized protein n=1 Tax=Nostoc flagelliforme CCNUN1 TaxID=2038116 RepID=A0A2K8SL97_9NOSO|nr:hypothetical protein [Nostoc flagelliforme]AUB36130.1 hypothetical protein COO91_02031 [Nostoc flagelliforme CCNUN1]
MELLTQEGAYLLPNPYRCFVLCRSQQQEYLVVDVVAGGQDFVPELIAATSWLDGWLFCGFWQHEEMSPF